MTARRSSATTSPPARRVRSDAKRNYERLLTAARDAFTEHGTEASLDAIAQQAGVGNATLYRHFPTRETLLEAVLRERFEQLAAREQNLLTAPDPAQALASWLTEFVDYTKTFHGLPASVIATFQDPTSPLYGHCHVVREAGARLLDRAVDDGAVRGDVSIIDVLTNATGIAWATERGPYDSTRTERLITVMMDGLTAPAALKKTR